MAKPEAKASKELRDLLEKRGAYTQKLHGNLYQIGVPDILVAYDTEISLVETKILKERSKGPYTPEQIVGLLRGPQFAVFSLIARQKCPIYIATRCYAYEDTWVLVGWGFKVSEELEILTLEKMVDHLLS